MYACVFTYRLASEQETKEDVDWCVNSYVKGYVILDQTARAIADKYSIEDTTPALFALAQGTTFDTDQLELELYNLRNIDVDEYESMMAWLNQQCEIYRSE